MGRQVEKSGIRKKLKGQETDSYEGLLVAFGIKEMVIIEGREYSRLYAAQALDKCTLGRGGWLNTIA